MLQRSGGKHHHVLKNIQKKLDKMSSELLLYELVQPHQNSTENHQTIIDG